MTHPYFGAFDARDPMILGHRGAAGSAPENTLPSFERCLALGAHAIESDVQVTADGVPVLLHDPDLARVSDRAVDASQLAWAELGAIDAGYHFGIEKRGRAEPDRDDAFRGQGYRVPSVAEAFEAFPEARFNLEIKTLANDAVAKVVALVAEHERAERTLLVAGDDALMQSLRAEISKQGVDVATSASVSEIVAVIRSAQSGSAPPREIQSLQVPEQFGGSDLVTPELVAHAHAHDIRIHVWTLNTETEMNRVLDRGVDGVVTDFPERAARLAASRAARPARR
jgi:glycerophosphoryl diester phosphodiesterase